MFFIVMWKAVLRTSCRCLWQKKLYNRLNATCIARQILSVVLPLSLLWHSNNVATLRLCHVTYDSLNCMHNSAQQTRSSTVSTRDFSWQARRFHVLTVWLLRSYYFMWETMLLSIWSCPILLMVTAWHSFLLCCSPPNLHSPCARSSTPLLRFGLLCRSARVS